MSVMMEDDIILTIIIDNFLLIIARKNIKNKIMRKIRVKMTFAMITTECKNSYDFIKVDQSQFC